MAKGLVPSLFFFLLCHCSTKHQPIVLNPYFAFATEDLEVARRVVEISQLESAPTLSLWDKKRLWDLYAAEMRRLKPSSRLETIKGRLEQLRQEIEPLEAETQKLVVEFLSARPSPTPDVFETEGLRRKYLDILKIWSRDENELAFQKINELLAVDVTKAERLKLLSVSFRIAYDIGQEAEMFQAHDKLNELEKCAPESANAGFLRSIYLLGKGEAPRAREVFHGQCDPDSSLSNRIRRAYWWYRFQEKGSPAAEVAYTELLKLPLSGYYLYLAKAHRGEQMTIALPSSDRPAFLNTPLEVSGEVHEAWTAAEEKIQANLRRDASLSLHKAAASLRKDLQDNVLPLLYTARLFQAAGNHLEAMKIYSDLIGATEEESLVNEEFLRAFPRPFSVRVAWIAKEWNVDSDFVYSLMRQESAFNPGAVSSADARGLMQMMPSLAKSLSKQWGYKPLTDEKFLFRGEENLKLSIFHLHQLQKHLPHPALVAGAYNAGLQRTSNWWRKFGEKPLDIFVEEIPVNETRNYIKLVLRNLIYYKAWENNGKVPADLFPLQLPPVSGAIAPAT